MCCGTVLVYYTWDAFIFCMTFSAFLYPDKNFISSTDLILYNVAQPVLVDADSWVAVLKSFGFNLFGPAL